MRRGINQHTLEKICALHREEAEQFYGKLREQSVRVGMEASGHARWFERLLLEFEFELWMDWQMTTSHSCSLSEFVATIRLT